MAGIEPDLQTLGVFQQKSYTNVGDPYKGKVVFINPRRPIDPSKPKWYTAEWYSKNRAATSDGYFGEFQRVFSGEAYNPKFKRACQARLSEKAKNISKEWTPASGIRSMDSFGSTSGLINETHPRLERATRPRVFVHEGKNFYVGPLKQGTGYGYLDVGINPYPEWKPGAVPKTNAAKEAKTYVKEWNPGGKKPDYFDISGVQGKNVLAPGSAQVHVDPRKNGIPNIVGTPWTPNNHTKYACGLGSQCVMINSYPSHSVYKHVDRWRILRDGRPNDKSLMLSTEWYPSKTCAKNIPSNSVVLKNTDLHHNSQNYKRTLAVWCADDNKLVEMTKETKDNMNTANK